MCQFSDFPFEPSVGTDDGSWLLTHRLVSPPREPGLQLLRELLMFLRGDFFLLWRRLSGLHESPRFAALDRHSSGCVGLSQGSEKKGTSCRPYPGSRTLGRDWQASIILSSRRSSSPLNIPFDDSTRQAGRFAIVTDAISLPQKLGEGFNRVPLARPQNKTLRFAKRSKHRRSAYEGPERDRVPPTCQTAKFLSLETQLVCLFHSLDARRTSHTPLESSL